MQLLAFSDVQATDGGDACYHDPSIRLQEWRVARFFDFLKQAYDEHRCDGLLDLGDCTDDRSAIPISTIDTVCRGLGQFPADHSIKLIGNHEQTVRSGEIHAGKLFEPFFQVIDKPCIQFLDDSATAWFCVPYPKSHDDLARWIEEKCVKYAKHPKVLLGHFQVAGALTRSGTWLQGIPLSVLDPFDLVLLGHIHKPQSLTERVHYVGSPFQQDWGEAGEAKRIGLLDTCSLSLKWIPVTGFPAYRAVSLGEFVSSAAEQSEDRYEVVLRDTNEAQALYQHPLAGRTRPRYDYAPQQAQRDTNPADWTLEAVLKRWMAAHSWDAEVDQADMLDIGLQIAGGKL